MVYGHYAVSHGERIVDKARCSTGQLASKEWGKDCRILLMMMMMMMMVMMMMMIMMIMIIIIIIIIKGVGGFSELGGGGGAEAYTWNVREVP